MFVMNVENINVHEISILGSMNKLDFPPRCYIFWMVYFKSYIDAKNIHTQLIKFTLNFS